MQVCLQWGICNSGLLSLHHLSSWTSSPCNFQKSKIIRWRSWRLRFVCAYHFLARVLWLIWCLLCFHTIRGNFSSHTNIWNEFTWIRASNSNSQINDNNKKKNKKQTWKSKRVKIIPNWGKQRWMMQQKLPTITKRGKSKQWDGNWFWVLNRNNGGRGGAIR